MGDDTLEIDPEFIRWYGETLQIAGLLDKGWINADHIEYGTMLAAFDVTRSYQTAAERYYKRRSDRGR